MGLQEKPVVTIWNKIDACPDRKEFLKLRPVNAARPWH